MLIGKSISMEVLNLRIGDSMEIRNLGGPVAMLGANHALQFLLSMPEMIQSVEGDLVRSDALTRRVKRSSSVGHGVRKMLSIGKASDAMEKRTADAKQGI